MPSMNMQYEKTTYSGDVQILKREPNEAIPLTLDFEEVTTKVNSHIIQLLIWLVVHYLYFV